MRQPAGATRWRGRAIDLRQRRDDAIGIFSVDLSRCCGGRYAAVERPTNGAFDGILRQFTEPGSPEAVRKLFAIPLITSKQRCGLLNLLIAVIAETLRWQLPRALLPEWLV